LGIANGKAVSRMLQNFSTLSFYKKTNPAAIVCLRASFPFLVGKILIAMPNADYQEIDLKAPQTKNNKYYF